MKKNIVLFSLISFSAILIDPFVNVKPAYSHKGYSKFNCKQIAGRNAECFSYGSFAGYKHANCVYKQTFKDGHRHELDKKKGEKKKCKRK